MCAIRMCRSKKGHFDEVAFFVLYGSPSWARTSDLRINSPALYQLSYRGIA